MIGRMASVMLLCIGLCACNNKVKQTETIANSPSVLIKVDKFKGKCIKCPHYTLDILDSPKANMNGKRNVPVLGESTFTINPDTYKNLRLAFKESGFANFEAEYLTNYMDLATTTISYGGHTVRFHDRAAPAELLHLGGLIDELIETSN